MDVIKAKETRTKTTESQRAWTTDERKTSVCRRSWGLQNLMPHLMSPKLPTGDFRHRVGGDTAAREREL